MIQLIVHPAYSFNFYWAKCRCDQPDSSVLFHPTSPKFSPRFCKGTHVPSSIEPENPPGGQGGTSHKLAAKQTSDDDGRGHDRRQHRTRTLKTNERTLGANEPSDQKKLADISGRRWWKEILTCTDQLQHLTYDRPRPSLPPSAPLFGSAVYYEGRVTYNHENLCTWHVT